MKRRLQILICSLCFMTLGGCEIFEFPLKLFSELLPLAIKYAPYALMFLEAPPDPGQATPGEDLAISSEISDLPLPQALGKVLREKSSGDLWIVAVQLKSEKTNLDIERWLKRHPGYKVRYVNTYCDFSDNLQYRQVQALLQKHEDVPFIATGPLEELSTVTDQQRTAWLDGLKSSE